MIRAGDPMRSEAASGLRSIHHVGITVRDLEGSARFYRETIGLDVVVPPTRWFEGDELARGLGVTPPVALRVALFAVGDGTTWFEILEYRSPRSHSTSAPPQNEIGAAHVAFHVADIEREYERLRALGVPFNSPVNQVDDGPLAGWRWVYFKDPDGYTMELVEVAYVRSQERSADVAAWLATQTR